MQLEPIADDRIDAACLLLDRGFGMGVGFWRKTIDRAKSIRRAAEWPVGYLFREGGRDVGVLIMFHSRRRTPDGGSQMVANSSSFYMEPAYDGLGSMRFARLVLQGGLPMHDLFPDAHFHPILEKLGFAPWSDGFVVTSWLHTMMARSTGAVVAGLRDLPAGSLSDEDVELLEDHERLGLIPAAINTGSGWRPLVFARRTAKRLPCGYLIYADSRTEAWRHRKALTGFLMRKGMPLLAVDWLEREKPEGATFVSRTKRFYRGDFLKDRIDFAYSDLVYSDVKARRDGIR